MASARRPHHPRRRQPAAQWRRDLGVREPDREDRPRKPLHTRRCACRARRSTIWPKASPCSGRTAASACPIRPSNALWGCRPDIVGAEARTSRRSGARCEPLAKDSPWPGFVAAVTGFDDERRDRHGQTELVDGTVLRYAVIHLPNGQVMMTFVDVTDSVNVERALKEKNEALQKCRPAEERLRPARLLRAALAAHQHHRLHRAAVELPGDRAADADASANMSSISARRPRCC